VSLRRDFLYLIEQAAKDAVERQPGLRDEFVADTTKRDRLPGTLSFGEAFSILFDMALRNRLDLAATQAEWRAGLRASRVASVALERITGEAGGDRRAAVHAADDAMIRAMAELRRERREREQGGDRP